jgi:hypothetical protein
LISDRDNRVISRRETVEHPFGTLKMRMGATHFLMKPKGARAHKLRVILLCRLTGKRSDHVGACRT